MLKRRRFKQLLSLKEDTTAPPRVPFRCSPHRSRRRDARPRHAHPGKDKLARCRQQGDPRGAGADPAARLRHHPTQTGHLINDVSQRLRPRIQARWWSAGPRGDKDQRPVSRTRNDPALSNGAAGLQDPETGIGRNAREQFETILNLTAQH